MLACERGRVRLCAADDGCGFAASEGGSRGFGVAGMRFRTDAPSASCALRRSRVQREVKLENALNWHRVPGRATGEEPRLPRGTSPAGEKGACDRDVPGTEQV